jgi:RNA polymerase sigma-70 factor (family 1)
LNQKDIQDQVLVEKIRKNDKLAFSILFTRYYADLVRFSMTITRDKPASEEIVQDLFVRFWEERNDHAGIRSLKSYLLKAAQNRSLDWLRHESIKNSYAAMMLEHPLALRNDTENYLLYSELEAEMQSALEKLPEECAEVFRKSRLEALKYEEIAEMMGISVRTVENRISKSIQLLRVQLRDFIAFF